MLRSEFNEETKELAESIAEDFNESYRAYLENRPNDSGNELAASRMKELKDIFDQQPDPVKVAVNTTWRGMHNMPAYEMTIEQIQDRSQARRL